MAKVCNRMNLYWGVCPVRQQQQCSTEDMVTTAETQLLRSNHVENGDVMGVVAGTQMSTGSTNFMRLHVVEPASKSTEKLRKASKKRKL
jgi:pyruvate kinase